MRHYDEHFLSALNAREWISHVCIGTASCWRFMATTNLYIFIYKTTEFFELILHTVLHQKIYCIVYVLSGRKAVWDARGRTTYTRMYVGIYNYDMLVGTFERQSGSAEIELQRMYVMGATVSTSSWEYHTTRMKTWFTSPKQTGVAIDDSRPRILLRLHKTRSSTDRDGGAFLLSCSYQKTILQ